MKAAAAILLFNFANLADVAQAEEVADGPVVFVCEHGSVKSLMASVLFNRAAAERGLPWRSVSRGLQPDARVPEKIAAAARLVTIGVDSPADAARAAIERHIGELLEELAKP